MLFETIYKDQTRQIDLDFAHSQFVYNNKKQVFTFDKLCNGQFLLRVGPKVYKIHNISFNGRQYEFTLNGNWLSVNVRDEQALLLDRLGFKNTAKSDEGNLQAPMPGKILEILRKEGEKISMGDPVIILEAMKMENELKSPASGIIKSIKVKEGQSVEKNEFLLEVETVG